MIINTHLVYFTKVSLRIPATLPCFFVTKLIKNCGIDPLRSVQERYVTLDKFSYNFSITYPPTIISPLTTPLTASTS